MDTVSGSVVQWKAQGITIDEGNHIHAWIPRERIVFIQQITE